LSAGAFAAFVPWLILSRKRHNLLAKYRRQLPEAASLIARSLRAGHALPTGLGMVADEFESPIGPAFAEVVEEINYGGSINDALKKLSLRFDIQETHFFTMGVALQRETGGNLAEILDNLARIIRERFRLENKVKILSAESRLTAWAMAIIPFLVLVLLHLINPKHTQFLMEDPTGRTAVLVALVMIALGVLVMRKMINFKI
jgi:tight adherence protein B